MPYRGESEDPDEGAAPPGFHDASAVPPAPGAPALTSRQALVLSRIRRLAAKRPEGSIEAGMIGNAHTCERLAELGHIVIELESVGPNGGMYYRYRPVP